MITTNKSEGLKELLERDWILQFAHDSNESFELVLGAGVTFPIYDNNGNEVDKDSVERDIDIYIDKITGETTVSFHAYPSFSARYVSFEDLHSLDKLIKEIEASENQG